MKVNVRFANGNGLAFLGQGYISDGIKRVFVRLYTTSDLTHVIVKLYRHRGYSFKWNKAKELGLVAQDECNNGTMLKFNRISLFYKVECYYEYTLMAQLQIALNLIDFKLL